MRSGIGQVQHYDGAPAARKPPDAVEQFFPIYGSVRAREGGCQHVEMISYEDEGNITI